MAVFIQLVASLDGNYQIAAMAIFVSSVFDLLDGRIARLTGTTSKFGVEYDSLSDLVAFGLAPGILIFTWALRGFGRYGWLAAFLYVVCATLRLARLMCRSRPLRASVLTACPFRRRLFVASTVLLFFYLHHGETTRHLLVLLQVYLLAFLMVSNVKFYSFKELNLEEEDAL